LPAGYEISESELLKIAEEIQTAKWNLARYGAFEYGYVQPLAGERPTGEMLNEGLFIMQAPALIKGAIGLAEALVSGGKAGSKAAPAVVNAVERTATRAWPEARGSASLAKDTWLGRRWGGESTMFGQTEGGFYTTNLSPTLESVGAPSGNTGNFLSNELFRRGTSVIVTPGGAAGGTAVEIVVPNAARQTLGGWTLSLPPGTP